MRKYLLFFLISIMLLTTSLFANQRAVLLNETFDSFPPTGWTEAQGAMPGGPTGSTAAWGGKNYLNGTNPATGFNFYASTHDEWLFTPTITMGVSTGSSNLEFDLGLTEWNSSTPGEFFDDDDRFLVVISTDGGTTWSEGNILREWDIDNPIVGGDEHVVIDISSYSGLVMFGFYAESTTYDADNDIFIDNVVVTGTPPPPAVFFSEYIEGSGNNKAIEIYNNTGGDIDLSEYAVKLGSGGSAWGNNVTLSGTLADGEVYVIGNSSADAALAAEFDITSNVTYYNGDDALGLFYNDTLIDAIGEYLSDPGSAWDVAGVSGATNEQTLIRKPSITTGNTDWVSSAGTNADDSEWLVLPRDTFEFMGSHPSIPPVSSFPWVESFEVWPPAGWDFEYVGTDTDNEWDQNDGSAHGPGAGNVHDGSYAAHYDNYNISVGNTGSMITPPLDLSGLANPQLQFFWWNNDSSGSPFATLEVYSSTNGVDYTLIETIDTHTSGTTTWVEYLSDLGSDVTNVKLTAVSDYGSKDTYVDLFTVREKPAVPPAAPINPVPADSAVSVDVNPILEWTCDADWFDVIINGAAIPGVTEEFVQVPFTLQYNTEYTWVVNAHNAHGTTYGPAWTFTTGDDPTITAPVAEGFEDAFPPYGWSNPGSGAWSQATWPTHSGSKVAKGNYAVGDYWLITPPLVHDNTRGTMSFWLRDNSDGYDNTTERFYVKVSTTDNDITSFTETVLELDDYDTTTDYQQFHVDLSAYDGRSTIYVAFHHAVVDSGNTKYLDDVAFGASVAPEAPINLLPADLTENGSLTPLFEWEGTAPNYDLYLSTGRSRALYAGDITENFYQVVTPLEFSTNYSWYVVAKNVYGENQSVTHSYLTMDDPTVYDFPFVEGFNDDFPPIGWTIESLLYTDWAQDDGTYYGPGSVYEGDFAAMFNNYDYAALNEGDMITPPLNFASLTTPQLIFYWWNNDTHGAYDTNVSWIKILTSTDGENYTEIDAIEAWGSNGWLEYSTILDSDVKFVKIKGISDYGMKNTFIDQFTIREAPFSDFSATDLDFGDLQVGEEGEVAFSISNFEAATENLNVASIIPSDPAIQVSAVSRGWIIAPGETVDFVATFTPSVVGEFTGYLSVNSNDNNPPNEGRINITANGVEPFPISSTDKYTVDMFVEVNETGEDVVTITNEGFGDLDLTSIYMDTRAFSVTPGSASGLGYEETAELNVSYTTADPTSKIESSVLTVETNEPPLPPGERFAGWLTNIPQNGWTTIDHAGTGQNWEFNNPGERVINTTSAIDGFAILDSDNYGGGGVQDADLITPELDLSGYSDVTLQFDHYFRSYTGSSANLYYSVDGGSNWNLIETWTGSTENATTAIYDMGSECAGQSAVQFKWNYIGSWGYYWAIDDVIVYDDDRSITDPEPAAIKIPVTAYTMAAFDSTDTISAYRGVNSVSNGRATDVPDYEWFNNVSEANEWFYEDGSYQLPTPIDYMGQEIVALSFPAIEYFTDFWVRRCAITLDTTYVAPEAPRSVNVNQLKTSSTICPSQFRDERALAETNLVSLAWNLVFYDMIYVSNEDFGTVVTWADETFFAGQIIIYNSGDIQFNYKHLSPADFAYMTPIGISGAELESQISYEDPDWVFPNLKPEFAIRFFPGFDDTASLPSTLRLLEDYDGINNDNDTHTLHIADYMPTGGEILTVNATSSDDANVTPSVVGNDILLTLALDYSGEVDLTYDISVRLGDNETTRMAGVMHVIVENVNDVPICTLTEGALDVTVEDNLLEDFGSHLLIDGELLTSTTLSNYFYDPDSDLQYSFATSDDELVSVEIDGSNLILTSIQDKFTYKTDPNTGEVLYDVPVEIYLRASEVARPEARTRNNAARNTRSYVDFTIAVSIVQVNDAPQYATPLPASINMYEDTSNSELIISDYFVDVDGDVMQYGFSGNEHIGVTIIVDESDPINPVATVVFDPEDNWFGSETILFTADDNIYNGYAQLRGNREQVSGSIEVIVTPVNDAPVVVSPLVDFNFDEDTIDSTSINLLSVFDDVDGDVLSYSALNNVNINVDIEADGSVVFTPVENWFGNENITFRASDGTAYAEDVVRVSVNAVNDAPTIEFTGNFNFDEGGSLTRNFVNYVNDVDGDDLTLSYSGNTEITVEITGLSVTFSTVDPMFFGSETITFTVDDGQTRTRSSRRANASDDVQVTVNYVNHAPVYNGPTFIDVLDEDFGTYTIGDLSSFFSDIDVPDATLNYSIVSFDNEAIEATLDGTILNITSVLNANGATTLRVRATDNGYEDVPALYTNQDIQIDIQPVNDAPMLHDLPENLEVAVSGVYYLNLENSFTDVDDPNPVIEVISPDEENFIKVERRPGYDYRWKLEATGRDTSAYLQVTIDDGNGGTDEGEFLVTIAASLPPMITYFIPQQEFEEDFEPVFIADLDDCFSDPDDPIEAISYDAFVVSPVDPANVLDIQIDEENRLYVGAGLADWFGFAQIEIGCSDAGGSSRVRVFQTVGFNILSVNDDPVVESQMEDIAFDEDNTYENIDVVALFNDVDLPYGDELIYTVEDAQHLTWFVNNGFLNLTPDLDWYGTDDICVVATDNDGQRAEIEFNVTVNPVDDGPEFYNTLPEEIMVNIAGQIIDFSPWINTHWQMNTIPLTASLIVETNTYYDIIPDPASGIYSLFVLPDGYQWGYPDQQCVINLYDAENNISDTATITFVTDMSPYVETVIPDFTFLHNNFATFNINLDNHFADPEGSDLRYEVYYNAEQVNAVVNNNILTVSQVEGFYGTASISVIAFNDFERASIGHEFCVNVGPFFMNIPEEGFSFYESEGEIDFRQYIAGLAREGSRAFTPDTCYFGGMDYALTIEEYVDTTEVIASRIDGIVIISVLFPLYEVQVPQLPWSTEFLMQLHKVECDDERNETFEMLEEVIVAINFFEGEDGSVRREVVIKEAPSQDNQAPEIYTTKLGKNYPNPFNPITNINYSVEIAGQVDIEIYNMLGQKVRTLVSEFKNVGNHSAQWNGKDDNNNVLGSGVYFYKMNTGRFTSTKKMIMMK